MKKIKTSKVENSIFSFWFEKWICQKYIDITKKIIENILKNKTFELPDKPKSHEDPIQLGLIDKNKNEEKKIIKHKDVTAEFFNSIKKVNSTKSIANKITSDCQ